MRNDAARKSRKDGRAKEIVLCRSASADKVIVIITGDGAKGPGIGEGAANHKASAAFTRDPRDFGSNTQSCLDVARRSSHRRHITPRDLDELRGERLFVEHTHSRSDEPEGVGLMQKRIEHPRTRRRRPQITRKVT